MQPHATNIEDCQVSFVETKTKSLTFGSSSRRLSVSRLLQSQIISISYQFDVGVKCPETGCNPASITSALQDSTAEVLNTSIENGQLLLDLQNKTGDAVSFISGASLETDAVLCSSHSAVTLTQNGSNDSNSNGESAMSGWYPVWGATECSSDPSGMTNYNSDYISSCK